MTMRPKVTLCNVACGYDSTPLPDRGRLAMIERLNHTTVFVLDQDEALRFYGIEATGKDNSGNWFSMSQHTKPS